MLKLFRAQPPAFQMIFILEMWERFGFYTVQGILTLYFIRVLGFSQTQAYLTFGAFFALVYGMVAMGGYLGDKVLGLKRTLVLGLVTLALGYLALALADKAHVFLALGLICVGNGLFKANPSNLLSKCYDEQDPRLHGAFTLYYMSINVGAIASLVVGPVLSSRYGYSYAFFASFIGLVLGLLNFGLQRKYIAHVNIPADQKKVSYGVWGVILLGIVGATFASSLLLQHVLFARDLLLMIIFIIMVIYFNYMRKEDKYTSRRMFVALILMIEAIVFFVLYQQMPTSINLFAVNNVTPSLLGLSIDPQSFQALNPICIILLSPIVVFIYRKLTQQGVSFPIPYKFSVGMFSCGLSFLILYLSRYMHDSQGMVSAGWLIVSYLFQGLGELLVSALGIAMVVELVPAHMTGFVMGMWFLTSSIAGFFGATVASLTAFSHSAEVGLVSLELYTHVFMMIGVVTCSLGVVMWVVAAHLSRYLSGASPRDNDPNISDDE